MQNPSDTYKTIKKPSPEILYKDKKSKFYGYAFPILNEEEVKPIIGELRNKYPKANHVCYAWQLDAENPRFRANDDGEPNNSAGMPIHGQIKSFEVTNVLVAVVRIFGGTKLGVGGLITAYRSTAQMALEASDIIEKIIEEQLSISFDYKEMDKIMRVIKENKLEIISQKLETDCLYVIAVRRQKIADVLSKFSSIPAIKLIKRI